MRAVRQKVVKDGNSRVQWKLTIFVIDSNEDICSVSGRYPTDVLGYTMIVGSAHFLYHAREPPPNAGGDTVRPGPGYYANFALHGFGSEGW